ncbi:hypothetical protein GCM10010965_26850 [Caldalkalibacillus thermarum]|uniref:aminotransferase class I/II-fold pyridoxal phosphate-dependent enzyme n=1 Tax=Caldalkalibacillus thermarum TaxID=296745 RepID=UPI001669A567|nr:aminotransferase class I/II-fold pyridoxal phosphate-dependent enzyme [Caldalkalibacillus thermarum]GGK32552.1 hypothetical protein GCM10010965_26850 [Caldalkalibacillus thermarum]
MSNITTLDVLKIVEKQAEALQLQSQALARQFECLLPPPDGQYAQARETQIKKNDTNREAIRQKVLTILTDITPYSVAEVKDEHYLISDLGLDSLMIMELLSALGQAFPFISSPRDVFENTEDVQVGQLIAYVARECGIDLTLHISGDEQDEKGENSRVNIQCKAVIPQCRIEEFPEYVELLQRMNQAPVENPYFRLHEGENREVVEIEGTTYINYSSYNYLGFAGHPRVKQAAMDAIRIYGTSVSASRLLSGEIPLHRELERAIARFIGTEDSVVYTSGHATNVSTIASVVNSQDLILHDELVHNSIIQGCLLSGAKRRQFAHNDWQEAEHLLKSLRSNFRRVLIVLEGAYSMDGDIAPLKKFVEMKQKYQAMLLVDEAHSIGTVGQTGRGICEYAGVNPEDVDFLMGTLSKSLASCGGYIAGSKETIQFLKYLSASFVYSAGITPANAAAALESLRILEEDSSYVCRLHQRSKLFLELCREKGLNTGLSFDTPIIPIVIGDSEQALKLSAYLFDKGIYVYPILYPAVPEQSACLRFFVTANHTEEHICHTVQMIAEGIEYIKGKVFA